jgi:2',3'-cyclic-nucleotide 2'-phosphodiesterase (5'-nucleotidase family)
MCLTLPASFSFCSAGTVSVTICKGTTPTQNVHNIYRSQITHQKSNSTGAQYVTLKIKWDEEKSKHVGLAQQNGFGPTFLHGLLLNTCYRRV